MMTRPTILDLDPYRVVDFGEDVYFEYRCEDSLGSQKWDNCLVLRGDQMLLPAGLVFGLLRLAEQGETTVGGNPEAGEAEALEPGAVDAGTKQAPHETKPAPHETAAEGDSDRSIEKRMYELQQRRRSKHRREVA